MIRRSRGLFGLLLPLGILLGFGWGCARNEPAPAPKPAPVAKPPAAPSRGLAAEAPDPALLAAALEILGDGREERCGPYRLFTDVDPAAGGALLAACRVIGEQLDGIYRQRFGLEPVGDPEEAVFLFARREDFRAFARRDGRPGVYAGYARGSRGFVVLPAEGPAAEVVRTLAHEMTHLVHRRALGPNLAPWLSEGLADAIGDAANLAGLGPLRGFEGVEAQARRLLGAYETGRAGSLERLTALDREDFDRGVPSFDYEQSALFVRFLLLDPDLSPRWRTFLAGLARGEDGEDPALQPSLGLAWGELEARFGAWLRSSR